MEVTTHTADDDLDFAIGKLVREYESLSGGGKHGNCGDFLAEALEIITSLRSERDAAKHGIMILRKSAAYLEGVLRIYASKQLRT